MDVAHKRKSSKRIRQIESKALKKLQHHTRADHLRGFVENALDALENEQEKEHEELATV